MFWKKGQAPPGSSSEGGSEPPRSRSSRPANALVEDPEVQAIESLAEVLRSMGRHSFDLDEVTSDDSKEAFEKWALRLLVGDVPTNSEEGPGSNRRRGIRRDWGGIKRFVEKHRQNEHEYVVTGMANLRQAVRVFIQCTTGNIRAERENDILLTGELDNLGKALAVNDHAQIRAAAEKTAATVRSQLDNRRSREERQISVLQESMERLKGELSQLRREAQTDGLTRVFNRSALDTHITQVADQAILSIGEACVVMVDIDHFKGINDTYGHQAGDEVLRQVADALVRGFFRREDFVSRYGGEEFCIIAQNTTFDTTRERAERLRQAVENLEIRAFGKTIRVSVSFGIASLSKGETASSWLKRADDALYRAKQKGRNRISIAPPEGDALGGSGKPLGAALSVRPQAETNPTIVHASVEEPRSGRRRSNRPESRAGGAAPQSMAANENAEKSPPVTRPTSKRKRGPTRPIGSGAAKKEAPASQNSPISALLGPSSRR